MPALVPSAGITMDERIRNLMNERGHQELLMHVDDPDLEARTLAALEILDAKVGESRGHGRTVARNLKLMARMGVYFEEQVRGVIRNFRRGGASGAGRIIFLR